MRQAVPANPKKKARAIAFADRVALTFYFGWSPTATLPK